MVTRTLPWVVVLAGLAAGSFADGLPLRGAEAERFLKRARVIKMKPIGVGITKPMKVTLTDDERTLHAVWKTIDETRYEVYRDVRGGYQSSFRDSYKYEIAAYELDKLLGTDLVPPTVERVIEGKPGSLQLWVEGAFTELERREQSRLPDDYIAWSDRIYKLRLLHQLCSNSDRKNIRNTIYDGDFRVYAIDSSRSFRPFRYLDGEEQLLRFSRSLLERLETLDEAGLVERLGPWLSEEEIAALLARRDLLLDAAKSRATVYGADTVFYP